MRAAVLLCALVVAYPMLRTLNLFPTDALVQLATSFSTKRAQSLEFRFDNEDRLLAKAMQRPLLGWGASGRARVYDEENGDDITVSDGTWIIRLGMRGFIGWAATFGFLLVPVWMARRSLGRLSDERDRIQLAGLALILSVYAIDLLPNALFTNFPIFIGGAVCGISKSIARTKPARADRWRRRGGSAPASRPRDRTERLFAGDYTPGEPAPRRPRTTSTLTGGGYSDMLR